MIGQFARESVALAGGETNLAGDSRTRLLDDPEVRMVALRALARMGPEARSAIPRIQQLLASDDIFVREAAIWTLGQIGSAAVEALAACARDDPDHNVASQARKALDWIWDHELNLYD